MRRIFKYQLTSCYLIAQLIGFICLNTSAQTQFRDVTNQPVLSYGAADEWDDGAVWFPSVIKDGDTLRMWYSGGDERIWDAPFQKIGYAWSLDGINWNRYDGNPVITPELSWEGREINFCTVLKDMDTLKMWYGAGSKPGGLPTLIAYATSFDGITWSKHPEPVIQLGSTLDWDDDVIAPHSVIKEGGEYKMWFWAGRPGFPFEESLPQIGLATSADGIQWTKYDDPATTEAPFASSDPALKVGSSTEWDSHRVANPIVLSTESGYEMWYSGLKAPINTSTKLEIGYATSADGIQWTKSPENPVIPDNSFSWGKGIYGGSILKYDGDYHFWFACFHTPPTQARPQIGYANSDPNVSIPDTAFLYALIGEGVDTNEDSLISYDEAGAVTSFDTHTSGGLRQKITDVTGIEAFVNLDTLNLHCVPIQTIDISKNTKLRVLDVSYWLCGMGGDSGNLTSLDVSNNLDLEDLSVIGNQLISLDVSNNTALKDLKCGLNQLTILDIRNNTSLKNLSIWDMPDLRCVSVWTSPFPPAGVQVDTSGSPNVYFTTEDCPDVGIKDLNSLGIRIYPNPTSSLITIETGLLGLYKIEITSLNGQLLFSYEMDETSHQLDLSSFQGGVYFITVRSKDFVTTRKIIKL